MTNVTLPFFFFAFPMFSTIIKAYSTAKGAAKAGITMKNAVNCGMIILLCMFSLFFVQPGLSYVTGISLCADPVQCRFISGRRPNICSRLSCFLRCCSFHPDDPVFLSRGMLRTVPPKTLYSCRHSHSPVPDPESESAVQTAGNSSYLSGSVRIRSVLSSGFDIKEM